MLVPDAFVDSGTAHDFADVHQEKLATETYPEIIVPLPQNQVNNASFIVETSGNVQSVLDTARREIRAMDASLPVYGIRTFDELLERSTADRKFQAFASSRLRAES